MRRCTVGLVVGVALTVAMTASPSSAVTTRHSSTVDVVCSSSGFAVDANALQGQIQEVTAFYEASGIVCRLYDGESGELLYDPSA